jgi:hypothetical protein
LPENADANVELYEIGKSHRAWALVTNKEGRPYPDFDSFCLDAQPWGLGTDLVMFRKILEARLGKQAADLETAPPEQPAGRPKTNNGNPRHDVADYGSRKSNERLRAIADRAPGEIRELYRQGLVSQTTAAMMGSGRKDEAKGREVLEVIKAIRKPAEGAKEKRAYRRAVDVAIRKAMGKEQPTVLDRIKSLVPKLSTQERGELVARLTEEPADKCGKRRKKT